MAIDVLQQTLLAQANRHSQHIACCPVSQNQQKMPQGNTTVKFVEKGEKLTSILGSAATSHDMHKGWLECWRVAATQYSNNCNNSSKNQQQTQLTQQPQATAAVPASCGSVAPVNDAPQSSSSSPPDAAHAKAMGPTPAPNNVTATAAAAVIINTECPLCFACHSAAKTACHVKRTSNKSVAMTDLNWWLVPACSTHSKRQAGSLASGTYLVANDTLALLVSSNVLNKMKTHWGAQSEVEKVKGWVKGRTITQ